jgi:hypothetical protein
MSRVDKPTPMPTEELLSPFHREVLSKNAVKLYEAVWKRMANRNVSVLWMFNDEASCRARVLLKDIAGAQSELSRAGLMWLTPGDGGQTHYRFVVDDEAEATQ